jgi:methylated-DNA-protein-cysteine methyltransferase related protein
MSTTELQQMIWQTVAAIPYGSVASYGDIARQCGYPNHARYVGRTLKNLPADSSLPWHRVIKANGDLAFPQDSKAFEQQYQRLLQEGIAFAGYRVQIQRYR